MKNSIKVAALAAALPLLAITGSPAASAATLKSTYSGVGYVFVCHGQELRATSGLLTSVYNSTQQGTTLKETTNLSTSPSLDLLGDDGLSYRIEGRSNAVVETVDYGTYSVASGKYSYDFTIYTSTGKVYGTTKGKSAVLPNQDVTPLTGTCAS